MDSCGWDSRGWAGRVLHAVVHRFVVGRGRVAADGVDATVVPPVDPGRSRRSVLGDRRRPGSGTSAREAPSGRRWTSPTSEPRSTTAVPTAPPPNSVALTLWQELKLKLNGWPMNGTRKAGAVPGAAPQCRLTTCPALAAGDAGLAK